MWTLAKQEDVKYERKFPVNSDFLQKIQEKKGSMGNTELLLSTTGYFYCYVKRETSGSDSQPF